MKKIILSLALLGASTAHANRDATETVRRIQLPLSQLNLSCEHKVRLGGTGNHYHEPREIPYSRFVLKVDPALQESFPHSSFVQEMNGHVCQLADEALGGAVNGKLTAVKTVNLSVDTMYYYQRCHRMTSEAAKLAIGRLNLASYQGKNEIVPDSLCSMP